jgi:mannosyltransferase OCH1-like enzyme
MIPKVIYITHKNIETIRPYSQKWAELNPDYTIELYDNERCIEFLTREYTQTHVDIFNFINDGPIKADFWRVCILYKYGGIYADADIVPLVPLSEYIKPNIEFATCISRYNNQNNYNPHFIMSLKDNPRLKRCIEWYTIYHKKKDYSYWGWSIVKLFNVLFRNIKHIDNDTIQMLNEINRGGSMHDFYCEYNNILVMRCRHIDYNPDTHQYNI